MRICPKYAVLSAALLAVTGLSPCIGAEAPASHGGWFVPKAPRQQVAADTRHQAVREAAASVPGPAERADPSQPQAEPILPAPPVPDFPPLSHETPPPSAIIGVISIPAVMRLSTAAQEAQRILTARRDKLAEAARREQAGWRAEQQKLQQEARNLTSEQIQRRERHLQERRAKAQFDFANRARIIQEAATVSLNQIERELVRIVRQVAAAHNMNLVLHAEQVVLTLDGRDITEETASQLNRVLPHVFIPAEGVDPEVLAKSGKMPTTADLENEAAASQPGAGQSSEPQSILRRRD